MNEINTPTEPQNTPQLPKKKSKALIITLVSVFSAIILLSAGVIGGALAYRAFSPNASPAFTAVNDGNATITESESSIAAVAEKVAPSVVSIVTETQSQRFSDSSSQAAGTGIVVSANGYIMTNNHVIDGASKVSVVDNSGERYEDVSVVGRDPLNDIAFLKVTSNNQFSPAELGNSSSVRIGQQVVAIGNALGQYNNTVTSGIISGTGRPVTASTTDGQTETLTDLIQTDASINPGNSGGPLLNMSGQVIGVNTAIAEDANGIGFSIPINSTKGVLSSVLETGKVNRAYMGVNYITITPDVAREYNLSVNDGAYVYVNSGNPVVSGSPADGAGMKQGDIITKINNETVGSQGNLSSIIGQYKAGDKVTVTFLRDGKEQTTSLTFSSYTQ
ncbi:MAG: trypsin-like peptidase domain-containing protein [Candidatus Microsaccharimonas sp.]